MHAKPRTCWGGMTPGRLATRVAVHVLVGALLSLPFIVSIQAARTERIRHILVEAVGNGDQETLRDEFAAGVDVNFRCYYDEHPSLMESWWMRIRGIGTCGNLEKYDETPLSLSISRSSTTMTRFLLDRGADPNIADDDGLTAVHKAARSGSDECLALLIRHGGSASMRTKDGQSPLAIARQDASKGCIKLLVGMGAPE
jgi:ankyrin repeat protein